MLYGRTWFGVVDNSISLRSDGLLALLAALRGSLVCCRAVHHARRNGATNDVVRCSIFARLSAADTAQPSVAAPDGAADCAVAARRVAAAGAMQLRFDRPLDFVLPVHVQARPNVIAALRRIRRLQSAHFLGCQSVRIAVSIASNRLQHRRIICACDHLLAGVDFVPGDHGDHGL